MLVMPCHGDGTRARQGTCDEWEHAMTHQFVSGDIFPLIALACHTYRNIDEVNPTDWRKICGPAVTSFPSVRCYAAKLNWPEGDIDWGRLIGDYCCRKCGFNAGHIRQFYCHGEQAM